MKLKIALAAGTALSAVVAAGPVAAGSNNTLYMEQLGDSNVLDVHQSSGGGGNDIGTAADPLTQDGNRNTFRFTNAPSGSGTNDDITKAEQIGDDNYMEVREWNNANNNLLQNAQQIGNSNQARISINGSDNGTIGIVLEQGNNNHLVIDQSPSAGTGNNIDLVKIIGDNNGLAPDSNGADKRAAVHLNQVGSYNRIHETYLEGSNGLNAYAGSGGHRSVQWIVQNGAHNGETASTAITLGSLVNKLWVNESGDYNNFDIRQGLSASSTGNSTVVTQSGNGNSATVTQYGDGNQLIVNQVSNGNTATALFTGDDNGVGLFTVNGVARLLDDSSSDLTQGTIFQDSSSAIAGNTVTYTVNGSSNQFAFAQKGGSNTITGIVGLLGPSAHNQVAVLQNGSGNTATFTQTGIGSNNAAISQ